ncbi:MAG: VOC family protein [Longimicrobiales bacterium]
MANNDRGRFVWHELMTSDTGAAENFYTRVVGWDTAPFENSPTPYTLYMAGEAPIAGLMQLPEQAAQMGAPPHWLAYIHSPDVDATAKQAEDLGATTLMEPTSVPGVGRFAILQDPQGATFALHQGETEIEPEGDPAPKSFSWHELATSDPDAAWDFYSKLFGWHKTSDMDMGPGGKYQMFGRDRFTYGGVYRKPDDMPAPPHWLHYAMVDSADEAVERAKAIGGQVVNGPMEVPGGDRIAVIVDPQGAAFAVHSKAKA